jgi:hypothetical protein
VACPVFREHSPAVDAREGTEAAHFPAKINYTTPSDAIEDRLTVIRAPWARQHRLPTT